MPQPRKKMAYISVINDLAKDERVHKVASYLTHHNINIRLIGRKFNNSPRLNRPYQTKRLKLFFNKKVWFYAEYNIRLFFFLLGKQFDFLVANDLDTLPANYLISRLRNKPLVYDSHEYFTELPELEGRKKVRSVWKFLEKKMLPQLKHAYTVNDSLAAIYNNMYGIHMEVIRNVPRFYTSPVSPVPLSFSWKYLVIYQGALNKGRGLEKVINAMTLLSDVGLLIMGNGDIEEDLKKLVQQNQLDHQVIFTGCVPFDQLVPYAANATIGLSLEESYSNNYYYALPNKLFGYIQARIPVLVSDFPEMKKIVEQYNIGKAIHYSSYQEIAGEIKKMTEDHTQREIWKQNLEQAANDLCWEKEVKKLDRIYEPLIGSYTPQQNNPIV